LFLEQHSQPCGLEVLVICQRFGFAQTTHHHKGNMIDDACLGRFATLVGDPCLLELLDSRFDQQPFLNQNLSQFSDVRPVGTTSRCVRTFAHHERSRNQTATFAQQPKVGRFGCGVPLVRVVPNSDHSNRVEKNVLHG
jgi:hypothetical protein